MLFAAAFVVTLLVIGVLAVYFLFDANQFRDELAAALSEQTGREVTLEGDLSLTVFPRLAVRTEGVTVGNAPAFGPEPMLQLERVAAGVDFIGLVNSRLDIEKVEVIGFVLKLAVRGDGMDNWSDLIEAASEADTSELPGQEEGPNVEIDASGGDVEVTFGGIEIRDASVTFEDGRSGSVYRLNDLDLTLTGSDLAEPLQLAAAFDANAEPSATGVRARLEAEIQVDDSNIVRVRDLEFSGELSGTDLPGPVPFALTTPSLVLDLEANSILLEPATVALADVDAKLEFSGSGPSDPLDLTGKIEVAAFTPAQLLPKLGIEAPVTSDPDALQSVSLKSDFAATFESASLRDLELKVDDTILTGALVVENFASMALRFDLVGDSMILDGYLPPAEDAEIADDAGDALAEAALPVDLLKGLDAAGRFRFGRLVLGDLPFESLDLTLSVANDKASLQPIQATVLEGRYRGDVRIDASGTTPRLSLNERIEDMNLGAMADLLFDRKNIDGRLTGNFKLAGVGETLADIRSSLNGDAVIELSDGALRGTDLWYEIRRARALFSQEPAPPAPTEARTEFSSIRGTALVSQGVATNDDLFAELPFLQLNGAGEVNLGDGTIDYDLDARVLERPEFLTDVSAEELDAYTEAVIPLEIKGEMASPSIRPDFERVVRGEVKRRLEEEVEELEDELKKRLRDLF